MISELLKIIKSDTDILINNLLLTSYNQLFLNKLFTNVKYAILFKINTQYIVCTFSDRLKNEVIKLNWLNLLPFWNGLGKRWWKFFFLVLFMFSLNASRTSFSTLKNHVKSSWALLGSLSSPQWLPSQKPFCILVLHLVPKYTPEN